MRIRAEADVSFVCAECFVFNRLCGLKARFQVMPIRPRDDDVVVDEHAHEEREWNSEEDYEDVFMSHGYYFPFFCLLILFIMALYSTPKMQPEINPHTNPESVATKRPATDNRSKYWPPGKNNSCATPVVHSKKGHPISGRKIHKKKSPPMSIANRVPSKTGLIVENIFFLPLSRSSCCGPDRNLTARFAALKSSRVSFRYEVVAHPLK